MIQLIFVTGDIHGNPNRLSTDIFPEQKDMTKDDVVIICGDFGLVWDYTGEGPSEYYWLKWLQEKPFTTVFVDGNHENFDRLNSEYPVKEWNGGKVHEIRPSVLHLMRGEVFTIQDKKIFAFGGASSHDIDDGILDGADKDWHKKAVKLEKEEGKYMYRVKGISWWEQELPSKEEMENGRKNLDLNDWKVDYVITHTPSASVVALLGKGMFKQDDLTRYLEDTKGKLEYSKWIAGHMHVNKNVNEKDICIYEQIMRLV